MWRVFFTNNTERQFRRLPRKAASRIAHAIEEMRLNPLNGDVVKLEGGGQIWRKRAGSYRILFEISLEKRAVFIYEIVRRTSKTYS